MISEDRVRTLLDDVLRDDTMAAPARHPSWTPECLPMAALASMADYGIDPAHAEHIARCDYCRGTIRANWAEDQSAGVNGWTCVLAAARAADDDASIGWAAAGRGAHALLTATNELRDRALSVDLVERLARAASVLAHALHDHDRPAAEAVRRLGHAVRRARLGAAGGGAAESVEELVSARAVSLAANDDAAALEHARDLHLTLGDVEAAGRCSRRLGEVLFASGRSEEAIVALSVARVQLSDGPQLADVDAAISRVRAPRPGPVAGPGERPDRTRSRAAESAKAIPWAPGNVP